MKTTFLFVSLLVGCADGAVGSIEEPATLLPGASVPVRTPLAAATAAERLASADCEKGLDDGNPCTWDVCEDAVPRHPNLPEGVECGSGQICNGAGACVNGLPKSCADARARGATESGSYAIDPNGGSPADALTVECDMTTDGGGWTLVFTPSTNDVSSSLTDYTVTNAWLWQGAKAALVTYRNAHGTVVGSFASFEIPAKWRKRAPFQWDAEDEETTVRIDGGEPTDTKLRYGHWTAGPSCDAAWYSSDSSFGRICFTGTTAPYFSGFATDGAWFSTPSPDGCADSSANAGEVPCSQQRRFTIAIR